MPGVFPLPVMYPWRHGLRSLVLIVLLILAAAPLARAVDHPPLELEVEVSGCTTESFLQVYFDVGEGFLDIDSVSAPIQANPLPQRFLFQVPAGTIGALRIDPLDKPGSLVIESIRFLTHDGREIARVDLHAPAKPFQLTHLDFDPDSGFLHVSTEPAADDPQFILPLARPLVAGPRTLGNYFWAVLPDLIPYELWMNIFWVVWLGGLVLLARRWLAARQIPWRLNVPATRWPARWLALWVGAPAVVCAWLLLLDLGHTPYAPDSESSWSAVLTYAIAHRWQFGPQVLLTYGPAMPLLLSAFSPGINGLVIFGELVCKAWLLVLLWWVGMRLPRWRRLGFWVAALILFSGISVQAGYSFSVVAAGLLFARGGRADRWLLAPTLVFLCTVTMIKVSFLLSCGLMLAAVAADLSRQRRGREALGLAGGFALGFCLEWCLFGQSLSNLPVYLRGSLEMVRGFTQAMSTVPDLGVVILALTMALAAAGQLLCLFLPDGRPRWASLPLLALLAGALALSWKASFVRTDGHVLDWFGYVLVSAAAAPAFVWREDTVPGAPRRWLEGLCLALVLLADVAGISRVNPPLAASLWSTLADRPASQWSRLLHPGVFARLELTSIEHNRRTHTLPAIRKFVGQGTVDMLGDEQAIALVNGLNYRPRPSFVGYSTYTPWLMDLDVDFYCSPRAPDFVIFKLVSIDERLPTLQSGPLLAVLARFYTPVLTEKQYVLFQRREPPRRDVLPKSYPLLKEGTFSIGDAIAPPPGAVWCELEMRETFLGWLQRLIYQQPPVMIRVDTTERVIKARFIPEMGARGFLLNPALRSTNDFVHWVAGQPMPRVLALRLIKTDAVAASFQKRLYYRFYQIPPPPVPPVTVLDTEVKPPSTGQAPGDG